MKKHLWLLVIAGLTLSLVGQYANYITNVSTQSVAHAAYPRVSSFREVINMSSAVVEGEVISVQPGPDNVTKLDPKSQEPGGVDVLPTTRVTLRIRSADKGNAAPGQEIVVQQTGGTIQVPTGPAPGSVPPGKDSPQKGSAPPGQSGGNKPGPDSPAPPPPPEPAAPVGAPPRVHVNVLTIDEDPPYQVGDHVYLALEDRPGAPNIKQVVHPAGRYIVGANNALQAVATGTDVALSVDGHQLAEVKRAARGEIDIATRPNVQKRVTTPGMPTTGGPQVDPVLFTWAGLALILVSVGLALVSFAPKLVPRRRRD